MTRILPIAATTTLALGITLVAAAAGDAGEHAEMTAVIKAPITPIRAVQIAESGGGRAYGFGMEATRNGHWYEVDVLRGNAHGEDAVGAHALDGSKLTLVAAIAQAERTGNGPALEAGASGSGANAHVAVDIINNGSIAHYRVSMTDNQISVAKIKKGTAD